MGTKTANPNDPAQPRTARHQAQDATEPRLVAPSLFFLAMALAFCEGIDIGSMGVTLSRLSQALGLSHAEAGFCASASLLGLVLSATGGGWLADRYGMRPVVIGSVLLLGTFSLTTAISWDFQSLLVIRFLTGLGMGALYPILLTTAREAAGARFRASAISMVVACGPLGALGAAIISLLPDWRAVFLFGGIGPLLALPVLLGIRLPDPGTKKGRPVDPETAGPAASCAAAWAGASARSRSAVPMPVDTR